MLDFINIHLIVGITTLTVIVPIITGLATEVNGLNKLIIKTVNVIVVCLQIIVGAYIGFYFGGLTAMDILGGTHAGMLLGFLIGGPLGIFIGGVIGGVIGVICIKFAVTTVNWIAVDTV